MFDDARDLVSDDYLLILLIYFLCVNLTELKGVITSIEKGVSSKEMRLMARANRQMLAVRRQLKASTVNAFLKHALPAGSEALSRLSPFVAAVCFFRPGNGVVRKVCGREKELEQG